MSYDLIPSICLTIVALFAIQAAGIYAVVKLVTTGRALADKRIDSTESDGRVLTYERHR